MRISLATLILAMLLIPAHADPAKVHVAIISDADDKDLGALVTTELSGNPDISLVERDDLAKAGDELKLQQLAGSNAVALGKLIGADGLLFIGKGPNGLQVRFTAVGLGYALFDDQSIPATELPQLAKSISHRVTGYAPKLKLDPAKAIPISVLNLRADYATANSTTLERKLTLLLESRLASQPDYIVLERRHAWSLGFEHTLTGLSVPLLQGAYVVDGTMSISMSDTGGGGLTIHLRLRSPANQVTPLEIRGTTNDLPGLVEQMMAQIRKVAGTNASASPWEPRQEAREYLLEGIWGWRNHVDDAALEALDSAELLGEKAPDLLAVRISVLCNLATGSNESIFRNEPLPDDPNPDRRIDAVMKAIQDQTAYQDGHLESKLEILDHFHSGDGRTDYLRQMVARTASKLVVMLDHANSPKAGEVRAALRKFANYDPLNGAMPGDWETAIDFADDWSLSLDEEVAYYRALCTTYPWAAYGGWRLQWKLSPENFCARFIPVPEARREAYFKFLHGLLDDPVGKSTGLLDLAKWADPAQKDAACRTLYDDLWAEREDLVTTKRICPFLAQAFDMEKERGVKVADPQVIALLHLELQRMDYFYDSVDRTWRPELFPPQEAPGLWKDLQDYEKRYESAKGTNGYFSGMNQRYTDRFGMPDAGGPLPEPLVVSRVWYPKDTDKRLILSTGDLVPTSDGAWVAGELDGTPPMGALYHINLDTFQTISVIREQTLYPRSICVTKEAVYLVCLTRDNPPRTMVERYDLGSNTWDEHEIPGGLNQYPPADTIYEVAGRIYVGMERPDGESGIANYDPKSGEITMLASNRRKPAQNQFDDRPPYRVSSIFAGPGEKPCAMLDLENISTHSFYINDQPGPWPPLTQFGFLRRTQTDGKRTLLYGPGSFKTNADIAVLVDPAKPEPELLLGSPAPIFATGFPGSEKTPPKDLPAWAQKPVWSAAGAKIPNAYDYGFRGDDLFALVGLTQPVKMTELIWYRRGQADPIHIPLKFEVDPITDAALNALSAVDLAKRVEESGNGIVGMTTTPQGICFQPGAQGFWFLPYTDIDNYLKDHPAKPPAPAASAGQVPPSP